MMKKITNYLLLALIGVLVFVSSCDDDEDPKAPPTITASPATIEGREGQTVEITVAWTAEAGVASVASSSSNATVPSSATGTSGTFSSTYTFGSADETVTFTITDNDGNEATSNNVTATVSENPQPTITIDGINDGDEVNLPYNQSVNLTIVLAAADGLKDFTASVSSGDVGTVTKSFEVGDQSGSATYEYGDLDQSAIGTEVTHTFTAIDSEDDETTFAVKTIIGKGTVVFTDANIAADQEYNLTKDIEYMFDGLVFAEKGSVVNIEPGTVIKFKKDPTTGDPTSAFVITRGAKIMAEGTVDEPIIFTAEADNLGETQNLTPADNQQWGGLVLLGSAPVMKSGNTLLQIEGISTQEPRGRYGYGDTDFPTADPEDNSGVLKYVSIRYTGFALNGQPGDEIQGLTLGGVGSGTVIDYVESFSSDDDGIEIFGGTVDLKHFIVAFASDDSYDLDEGWRGKGQFLFALQGDGTVSKYDHAGEWDGAGNTNDDPFSAPNLVNCTFIGPGVEPAEVQHDRAILWREGFAGKLLNSIITDMPVKGLSITNENTPNGSCDLIGSQRDGFETEIWNTTFANVKDYTGSDIASIVEGDCAANVVTMLNANNVMAQTDKVLENTDSRSSGVDPRPVGSFAGTIKDPTELGLSGFDAVDYQGAFKAGEDLWLRGWSTLSKYGYTVQ